MLDITITETRDFVKKLLMDNTFDRFLAMEAFVKSGITYSFDGRINKDFYDKEELELMASTSYASWESIKPHVYNVIRGKKLPLSFKIVLVLSQQDIIDMLEKNRCGKSHSEHILRRYEHTAHIHGDPEHIHHG